jgi:carotenoid 1,2-hydratase
MTERRAGAVTASKNTLQLGPSRVRYEDGALIYDIEEHGAPLPRPVRGRVVIRPEIEQSDTFTLDRDGRHVWRPVWPRARVEAQFDSPDLKFEGDGYVDMNAGSEPLERAFSSWNWSRAPLEAGAAILYDSIWPDGAERSLALRINTAGKAESFEAPPVRSLPNVGWGVARETRSDSEARVVRTLEDTPFYSRSLVETDVLGGRHLFMHESLDLKRFSSSWVKCLLPFRMPRAF